MQPGRVLDVAKCGDAVGERDHCDSRRTGKAEPGGETSRQPRAQHADRHAGLARRRSRQELAQRDDVGVGRLVEPFPPLDELGAEVAEMRDRAAKARAAEAEEGEQNRDKRPIAGVCDSRLSARSAHSAHRTGRVQKYSITF